MRTRADDIVETMTGMADESQRVILQRFFKTGPGQYGEGDKFLGIKVPSTRMVVGQVEADMELGEVAKLLLSPWHEVRLCGLLILVKAMAAALPKGRRRGDEARRQAIVDTYLANATRANNWDLVDLSAPGIVGAHLLMPLADGSFAPREVLYRLVESPSLWEQRIAIVSTLALIRSGEFADTLALAVRLESHPHDLIHKATGWMLREVGKRDVETLRSYLAEHAQSMPRTALRYAIEKLPLDERLAWMGRRQ